MGMNHNTSSGGIGFAGILTITFIVLKLTNVISWSWVWVLSPLWISLILCLIFVCGLAISVRVTSEHKRTPHKGKGKKR